MNTSVASNSFLFWHLFAFYLLFLVIYLRTLHGLFHAWRMWVSGARSVGFPTVYLLFLSTPFFCYWMWFALLYLWRYPLLAFPLSCLSYICMCFACSVWDSVIRSSEQDDQHLWESPREKWLHYQTCIAVDAYIQRAPCVPQGDICFETCRSIYCRLAGFFQDKPPGHGSGVMSVFILLCLF